MLIFVVGDVTVVRTVATQTDYRTQKRGGVINAARAKSHFPRTMTPEKGARIENSGDVHLLVSPNPIFMFEQKNASFHSSNEQQGDSY